MLKRWMLLILKFRLVEFLLCAACVNGLQDAETTALCLQVGREQRAQMWRARRKRDQQLCENRNSEPKITLKRLVR